jgi:murein DD-endopeptidase MepM/ murein hydrolase activator NlpD
VGPGDQYFGDATAHSRNGGEPDGFGRVRSPSHGFIQLSDRRVELTGRNSLATWYGHVQALDVAAGQVVGPAEQIGKVGDLGNATGCHLHFEVHLKNGSSYGPDHTVPSPWLAGNT